MVGLETCIQNVHIKKKYIVKENKVHAINNEEVSTQKKTCGQKEILEAEEKSVHQGR